MSWLKFYLVLLGLTLLDAGNLMQLIATPGLGLRPDLLLIFLVFCAANGRTTDAILASFIIGFAADVSSENWIMGPYAISFGVIGSLICQLRKVVIMRRMLYQAITIYVAGLTALGLGYLLVYLRNGQSPSHLLLILAGTSLYSAIVGPFVWVVLAGMGRWLGVRPNSQGPLPVR